MLKFIIRNFYFSKMGLSLSSFNSFDSFKPEQDKDANEQQKSAAERMRNPSMFQLDILTSNIENLIAFSHKKYSVKGQLTGHYQIEILARRRDKNFRVDYCLNYSVFLISFNKDGLVIKKLDEPYDGIKKKFEQEEGYIIQNKMRKVALYQFVRMCRPYQSKQYSLVWFNHCQDFANKIRDKLKQYSEKPVNKSQNWLWQKRKEVSKQQQIESAGVPSLMKKVQNHQIEPAGLSYDRI